MKNCWELKRLDELFDVKSSKRVHKADWKSEGVPFYRAREVVKLAENGTVDNDLFISEELFEEFTKEKGAPKQGDIIISAVGTLGQCYLVKRYDRFYFKDASVLWFEKISDVETRYIEFAFKSDLVMNQVMHKAMGATVGTLTISRAKNIEIPIPPLQEQKQIVAILDKAFEAIEKAKANIERNIENAKELFQSKLNEVFSQKGEGWEKRRLGELCSKTNAKNWKEEEGEFQYIDLSSVSRESLLVENTKTINRQTAPSRAKKIVLEGDVIFATTRPTLKRVTIINKNFHNQICSTGYCVLRPRNTSSTTWMFYFLLTDSFYNYISSLQRGTSYPAVTDKDVKNSVISVSKSSLLEKEYVELLNELRYKTEKLLERYNSKLELLSSLRESIMKRAFKGSLTKNNNNGC